MKAALLMSNANAPNKMGNKLATLNLSPNNSGTRYCRASRRPETNKLIHLHQKMKQRELFSHYRAVNVKIIIFIGCITSMLLLHIT